MIWSVNLIIRAKVLIFPLYLFNLNVYVNKRKLYRPCPQVTNHFSHLPIFSLSLSLLWNLKVVYTVYNTTSISIHVHFVLSIFCFPLIIFFIRSNDISPTLLYGAVFIITEIVIFFLEIPSLTTFSFGFFSQIFTRIDPVRIYVDRLG